MQRKHDNGYFHFTKKERTGIIVLLITIILYVLYPQIYPLLFKKKVSAENPYLPEIEKLIIQSDSSGKAYKSFERHRSRPASYNEPKVPAAFFYFDPNTIPANGWERLGVNGKAIATIRNYLAKGGKFREPADIKKIWGLKPGLAEQLIPYVRIADPPENKKNNLVAFERRNNYARKEYHPVDINTADTGSLTRLPGIGTRLSQRILNYRDKLGGFYSADQVAETFGLPDSTFRKIRSSLNIGTSALRQININAANSDELKSHPYIRYHIANAIVQYRQQHGSYRAVSDIRHIMLIDDSIYKKISPYLSIQ